MTGEGWKIKSQGLDIGTCVLEEQGDQMDRRGMKVQVPCLSWAQAFFLIKCPPSF